MFTFVKFQAKIDENNLNVNQKLTSFWGSKVLLKKIEFEQKVRVLIRQLKTAILPILKTTKNCSLNME